MSAMRMSLKGAPLQRVEPPRTVSALRSLRKAISTPVGAPSTSRRTGSVAAKVFKPDSEDKLNGAPDWRSVPKEAMALFETAQEHMLTLNNSRLKALEELKVSKKRIAELQVELEEAKAELAAAQAVAMAGPAVSQEPVQQQQQQPQYNNGVAEQPQETLEFAAAEESSGGEAASPAPVKAPAKTITILYATGWHDCFAHFNLDDKGWTEVPGWQMVHDGDVKQLVVEGSKMEFCLNNGGSDWDAPPGNYVVSEPGIYIVSGGQLQKQ